MSLLDWHNDEIREPIGNRLKYKKLTMTQNIFPLLSMFKCYCRISAKPVTGVQC